LDLQRASVTRRRCLPTSNKELKSKRDIDIEVKSLDFESGAQADCSFKFNKSCKNWAALVHNWITKANVH
jgi:hypothetical protein